MAGSPDFDRDVISPAAGAEASGEELRTIITLISRASHDIADLVSLGDLAPAYEGATPDGAGVSPAATSARQILIDHLTQARVRVLCCAGGTPDTITIDEGGRYAVTIEPLEGIAEAGANLPFGTIFSIASGDCHGKMQAAGFIHYGPQTNLVFTLGSGVHIFNLDRTTRTYRLAAENIRMPDSRREWSIDVTKRGRWPSSIRALIDEELSETDAPGAERASVRWTGSLTADAYRVLRQGGIYLSPADEQSGHEVSCPSLKHAARPIAFIIEQAGGRATTGAERLVDRVAEDASERTTLIFGSPGIVARVERLHALPENQFDSSPLFRTRGLFRV